MASSRDIGATVAIVLTDQSIQEDQLARDHHRGAVPPGRAWPFSRPTPSPARSSARGLGRGQRPGGAPRRAHARGGARAAARGQGVEGARSSTPASAGSPGPTRTAGGRCRSRTSACTRSLESRFDTPSTSAFGIGLGMVAPTILAHATDEVKDAYLRKLYRGDIVACQLFSEPAAGSDLAGLQTTRGARRRRVDHQRPEGVDVGRAVQRHRRDHLPHRPRRCPSTRASPASSST